MSSIRGVRFLGFSWVIVFAFQALAGGSASTVKMANLTPAERMRALQVAQVWYPTDIPKMDLISGPRGHFKPGDNLECTYDEKATATLGGVTPKFACRDEGGQKYKIKYGQDNAEVFASVVASRIFWALGFGADRATPLTVICHHCSSDPWSTQLAVAGTTTFKYATLIKDVKGQRLISAGKSNSGWAWTDLDEVSETAGGAPVGQRDALKLLAAMLQHADSGSRQQRIICLGQDIKPGETCKVPFMYIHDLGGTFGGGGGIAVKKLQFNTWKKKKVWKDADHCVADIRPNLRNMGALKDPVISEEGRQFLSGLLSRLGHQQIVDAFTVGRVTDFDHKHTPDDWANLFEQKETEIFNHSPCPENFAQ